MRTIPRAVVIALYGWTKRNEHVRAEYYEHPIAFNGRDTCSRCAAVAGSSRTCDACHGVRSMRKTRAKRRSA